MSSHLPIDPDRGGEPSGGEGTPRIPIDPDRGDEPRRGGEPSGGGAVLPARGGARRPDGRVLAAIALGGALGAPARYGVAQVIHVAPDTFPWATFWTNVSGSFGLGLVLALLVERFPPRRYLRPFVATGFIGAFTTYSTFAVETDVLVKNGHLSIGLAYAGASLVAGFAAVWAGLSAARAHPDRRANGSGGEPGRAG